MTRFNLLEEDLFRSKHCEEDTFRLKVVSLKSCISAEFEYSYLLCSWAQHASQCLALSLLLLSVWISYKTTGVLHSMAQFLAVVFLSTIYHCKPISSLPTWVLSQHTF